MAAALEAVVAEVAVEVAAAVAVAGVTASLWQQTTLLCCQCSQEQVVQQV